jgi:hypothetical protein
VFAAGAWPVTELQITSIGPPHELHADGVVAQMMRHLIEQATHVRDELQQIIAHSNDGGERAQRKLRDKLQQAGTVCGRRIVACNLTPGKRGRYQMRMMFWSGWNRDKDREIGPDHKIPKRPWICLWYTEGQRPRASQGRVAARDAEGARIVSVRALSRRLHEPDLPERAVAGDHTAHVG